MPQFPSQTSLQVRFLILAGLLVGFSHALDPWAQVALANPDIYEEDFGRLLRVMGYYPLWLAVAVGLILTDWHPTSCWKTRRAYARRGFLVIMTPALGGLVAELGKLVFRRLRPGEIPGEYVFRSFAERPFYSGGLGLPSSHTLVAFAAAAIMARIFPRTAPVWFLLAIGCGLSRVAAGAHYLSDVTVAGVLGWAMGWVVWSWHGRNPVSPVSPALERPNVPTLG